MSGAGGESAVGVDGGGKPLGKESVWPGGGAAWLKSVGVVAVGVVGVLSEGVVGVVGVLSEGVVGVVGVLSEGVVGVADGVSAVGVVGATGGK